MRIIARLPARIQDIATLHPYGWSIVVVAAVTVMLFFVQQHINAENIALFYLVAVLLCAVTAGRAPAVFGAVVSFLVFKLLFVEPRYTLTVDNITDPWQLSSFVAAALIAAQHASSGSTDAVPAPTFAPGAATNMITPKE